MITIKYFTLYIEYTVYQSLDVLLLLQRAHRCFRQENVPFRQAHLLLLIFWYIREFVYKDTISIYLHTIIKVILS